MLVCLSLCLAIVNTPVSNNNLPCKSLFLENHKAPLQCCSSPSCCAFLCSNLEYEVVIIDDNSPDGTQEVVKRLQTAYSSDRIVRSLLLLCSAHADPCTA